MREQFYLALPMKPLCRDDCKGLCPTCGTNLERERLRLPSRMGGSRGLRRLKSVETEDRSTLSESRKNDDAESKTTTLEDADGQAPHARRAEGRRPQRMPALPRGQAAAPRLPELRLLPRPPGARRRRRLARLREPGALAPIAPDGLVHPNRTCIPMIWIAVDAMGGDDAPGHIVDGALAAARHFDLGVALVGPAARLEAEARAAIPASIATASASSTPTRVVEMAESPAAALRRKPTASIRVAAELVARGEAAALFSAGHTGATVMAAHGAFGMLPGVDRPALAATIPTRRQPAVLLDVGASVECRPQHLLQFAVMGSVYARVAFGIDAPRVGLLSIGEEETKGNELTREAHRLLKASPLAFIGNVEARDVYSGAADVIVCDGFTGNIALKVSEGLVEVVEDLLREELSSTITMRVGSLLTRRALRHFRRRVDYSEYGGAPLLGVAGIAIVGHGRSSAKAVRNAVAMAYRFAAEPLHRARRARDRRAPQR